MEDDHTENVENVIKYRRRLDRTPDKNFTKLPYNEKRLLSTLRTALEEAKSRIVRLRDENDIKDDIIEEERRLRRAVEERLQNYLVDLYNNPDVNTELRQRLPRAKQYDPLHQEAELVSEQHIADSHQVKEHIENGKLEEPEVNCETWERKEAAGNIGREDRNDVGKASLSQPFVTVSAGNMDDGQHMIEQPLHQSQTQRGLESVAGNQHMNSFADQSASSSAVGFTQNPGFEPLTAASISHLLPPYIHSAVFTNPLSSASMSSLESSSYQGLPPVRNAGGFTSQSDFHPDQLSRGQASRTQMNETGQFKPSAATQGHTGHGTQTAHVNSNTLHSTPRTGAQSSVPLNSSLGPSQQSFIHSQLPSYPSRGYDPISFRAYYGTDNVSHISRLLVEIATLKKENEEVREKLKDAKHDIELLKVDLHVGEETNMDKLGALIEEVHAAEKKRDKAVKMMMETADEDKAAALGELDRMRMKNARKLSPQMSLSESELTDVEDDDEEVVSSSGSSMNGSRGGRQRRKSRSQQSLERLVARQREIMRDELQKVIDQRNEARQRVLKLEKKLSSLEQSQFTDNKVETLMAKLRLTERERDIVVAKLKFLTQDVNETKLLYNLHKALLSEDPVNDFSSYPFSKTSSFDNDSDFLKNNNMAAQLSRHAEERAKLETKIEKAEKDKKSQAQRIEKLEQLVLLQRQKLNAICAGPMLTENV